MGQPKAWLPFGGEFMLQRVVRVLSQVVDPVVVVAAPVQDVPALSGEVQVVRDEIEGRGPLGGLAAGLAALEGKTDAAYVSSCDVPFLKPEFLSRVISLCGEAAVCVPRINGYYHPLAAVYRLSVLPQVRELIAGNHLRAASLFERVPTRIIGPNEVAYIDSEFRSLRNLNTPEEYEAALRELASQAQ
jgi:molybdopterin-guanine dinucleotide biosynthesis protein A